MLVPVGGLEPPHPKATDFESVVSTNSTTLALKKVRRILYEINLLSTLTSPFFDYVSGISLWSYLFRWKFAKMLGHFF